MLAGLFSSYALLCRKFNRRRSRRIRGASSRLWRDVPRSLSLELYVLPDGGRLSRKIYGGEGSRTPGLCSAIAALSQLSYTPGWSAPQLTNS